MAKKLEAMGWYAHIRRRASMYIGRIGDGSDPRDGVYTIFKENLNNAIDEFRKGFGNVIEVTADCDSFTVRDYGHGLDSYRLARYRLSMENIVGDGFWYNPVPCSLEVPPTIGLSGFGMKLNLALSSHFYLESHQHGQCEWLVKKQGEMVKSGCDNSRQAHGTLVKVTPDKEIFEGSSIRQEIIEEIVKTSACLNKGLTIVLNGTTYYSERGLLDLVSERIPENAVFPPIHLERRDIIEIVLSHAKDEKTELLSFVNGHFTKDGGTHQTAFKRALASTLNRYFGTRFRSDTWLSELIGAININILNPVFENAVKSTLSSEFMGKDDYPFSIRISEYVSRFIEIELPKYLTEHPETEEAIRNIFAPQRKIR